MTLMVMIFYDLFGTLMTQIFMIFYDFFWNADDADGYDFL